MPIEMSTDNDTMTTFSPTTVAVAMTCHNRKSATMECLRCVFHSAKVGQCDIQIVLVDDGSTDGTSAAVLSEFPEAHVIQGCGSLFWNGGMRVAIEHALGLENNFLMWLNDDTILDSNALEILLATYSGVAQKEGDSQIVVGTTRDSDNRRATYGGLNRRHKFWRPVTFNLVQPADHVQRSDTMNGNCVLIPIELARRLGNLDQNFKHSMGDTDYGLRAQGNGAGVWVAPGTIGVCNRNSIAGSFVDPKIPIRARLQRILGPKGMPPRAWWVYVKRHGGALSPFLWLWPYIRVIAAGLIRR